MSAPCEVERLVLLLYPGELEADSAQALRVHLSFCARCEEIYAELEEVAAQLDRIPEARLSAVERRSLLARVVEATLEASDVARLAPGASADDSDLQAALDLVDLSAGLDEDARASLREGVLARVGLGEEFVEEDFAALKPALDLVEVPRLSEDARASLRDAVLARVGLAVEFVEEDFAALGSALDRVETPSLSEDARASLRDTVLARVGLRAELAPAELAQVGQALDWVEAPSLSDDARTSLRDTVLARVGVERVSTGSSLTYTAPLSPLDRESAAPRRGLLLRLPAWSLAAAAALLLAGSAALYFAQPAAGTQSQRLAAAFVDAEKLVRDANAEEDLHLAAARDRLQGVVLTAQSQSGGESSAELRRARRELLALGVLNLRGPDAGSQGPDIRPVPLRRSPEDFLRSKWKVLQNHPESLASLFVLKCYTRLVAQRESASPTLAEPSDDDARLQASLSGELDALRARDSGALDLDVSELEKRFAPPIAQAARQALWIQRGLQAERQGAQLEAQAWYQQAHDDDPSTDAAKIALSLAGPK